MRSPLPKPSLYAVPGGVHSLSGKALEEFLRAVLAKGASFRFEARGLSMHPFIKDQEVITISPVQRSRLYCGDVVAFCHPETGRLTVHRIVKKNAQDFITQNKYTFHVLLDNDNKVIESYKVNGIPTKFIIDKDGNIRFKSVGFDGNADGLVEELSTMIAMLK